MRASSVFSVPFCFGTAVAQVVAPDDARGAFQSIPHFITAFPASTNVLKLGWKPEGDLLPPNQPIVAVPMPGSPVYTLQAMFGVAAGDVDLDAISAGSDHVPNIGTAVWGGVTQEGCLNPDGGGGGLGWVAITFSLKHNLAHPISAPGSIIEARLAARGPASIAGDLYGYFLPGSNTNPNESGVPSQLPGHVYLEQGREHMNLPSAVNLDGHDAYMPYIQAGAPTGSLIYTTNKFFFSVTPASAIALTSTSQALFGGPVLPGNIYYLEWKPANMSWSSPRVFRTAQELGLTTSGDIDALAVRSHPQRGDAILFSTATSGPVLYVQGPTGTPVREARNRDGSPLRLVVAGDIDSISVYDPEGTTANKNLGFPIAHGILTLPSFSLCMTSESKRDTPYHLMSVSGLRPTDVGTMQVWTLSGPVPAMIDSFAVTGGAQTLQRRVPADTVISQDVFVWLWLNGGGAKYSWPVRIQR